MPRDNVEHILNGLTALEFLEWLDKREVFLEGPGRILDGGVCIKLRDLRDQSAYEGTGRGINEAILSALGFLFDEREGR